MLVAVSGKERDHRVDEAVSGDQMENGEEASGSKYICDVKVAGIGKMSGASSL